MGQRKKFIVFTAFVMIALAVFCAFVTRSTKKQTLTVTDADGVTYVAVYGQDNKTYAAVTDKDGNVYAAPFDENGNVLKDETVCCINNYNGTFPFNDTTRTDDININQSNEDLFNAPSNIETKASEPASDNTNKSDETTNDAQNAGENKSDDEYMSDKFIKLFNSGIFVMTFTTDDPELTGDITLAMRNGSIYMDTSMEGISCKVIFDSDKKSGYIIIPQMRVYCLLPEDLASELATGDLTMPELSETVKKETSEVVIDGKDCICEEFSYEDGSLRSFYYYNGNLIRMVVFEDSETTVYNIKSISSEVDNSYFEVPKGYLKVNLSWLQSQN